MDISQLTPEELYNTPALAPPPGVVPDFSSSDNIDGLVSFTLGICLAVTSLLVLLRIYAKVFIIRKTGWDDYFMVIAWLGFVGYSAIGFVTLQSGTGKHQWDVRLPDFIMFAQMANVEEIYYSPLIFFTKLSILIQYYNIFVTSKTSITARAIYVLVIVNLLYYLAIMLVQIMICLPREKIWDPLIPGHCVDQDAVFLSGGVLNIVSDFIILILPIANVWTLQIDLRRRIGLAAVFAIGLFACISSIMRTVTDAQFENAADVTYLLTPVALWTVAELASGIICGCLPSLPAIFRHYVPKVRATLAGASKYGNSNLVNSKDSNISMAEELSQPPMWTNESSYIELEEGYPQRKANKAGGIRKTVDVQHSRG